MAQRIINVLFVVLYILNVQFPSINPDAESNNKKFSIIWISDTQDMAYNSYDHALEKMGVI